MRELREHIVTEGWRPTAGRLVFSEKQVELTPSPKEVVEGVFEVSNTDGNGVEGFVRTDDERMQCLTSYFNGSKEQISYRFCADGMQEEESRSGRFFILSSCGEYELPWKVVIKEKPFASSLGEITSLTHFTNLARAAWREAVALFYSKDFKQLCQKEGEEVYQLYRGLSVSFGNEANVEEFLCAAHKKQPIAYSAVTKELSIPEIKGQIREEITISRNGWGAIGLGIRTQGDFLSVEKQRLSEDNFLGNQCRVSVFLDGEKMHEGENFGAVTFSWQRGSFTVPVTVEKSGPDVFAAKKSRELKKCNLRMVKVYQDYRMKRIDRSGWRAAAKECTEQMAHLMERSAVPKLFDAQLYMTEERWEEAGWILQHVRPLILENRPAEVCYYFYLMSLFCRDEEYSRKATKRVEEIFSENPKEWRIAWLLLFLSRDLNRSAQKKWDFLREQFEKGCTSPVLYLEALILLNAAPTLISGIDPIVRRILAYGARQSILSQDLTGHVICLINREKYYDPVLLEILTRSWEKRQDTETLQAICTLLIKGQKTGKEYFSWYQKGVMQNLRITRLYEHWLMSVDQTRETAVPKTVLLYFAYQSNLEYEYAAWLYAYVERHRQEEQELYLAYRAQMERFVQDCVSKGRINRNLDYLYRHILQGELLDAETERKLAALLGSTEVSCRTDKKRLVVVHARLKGEKSYVLRDGKACVGLYSPFDKIFTEDEFHNRRFVGEESRLTPYLADCSARQLAGDTLSYHLAATATARVEVTPQNADSYFALLQKPVLAKEYERQVRMALLDFYAENERTEELNACLKQMEADGVSVFDKKKALELLIRQGFYEKAYEWEAGMDFSAQEPRLLMRLCSRLLEQQQFLEEERMTELCFASAIHGKYDSPILSQLVAHYEGSCKELEIIKTAAEGFGVNTFLLCERLIEQMLFCGKDVTERTDLARQYVREGGRSELERAFLHRCSYSFVMEKMPVHIFVIRDICRMYKKGERLTDLCKIACLQYYANNRASMDREASRIVVDFGNSLIAENRLLPVLQEFADIIPDAALLLDKTFVVYQGDAGDKAVLHYRILKDQDVETEYQSGSMQQVYDGIYTMAFILFPGENLQYYITRLTEPETVMDSGLLKALPAKKAAQKSRYGMLSAVAVQLLAGGQLSDGQWQSLELLDEYLYTDYCVEKIFETAGERNE